MNCFYLLFISSYQLISLAGITTDLVRPLLSSMRSNNSSVEVQKRSCDLISKMGTDKVSSKLGEMGAIQDLLSAIRSNMKGTIFLQLLFNIFTRGFILDELVLIAATKALWSLCVNELNAAVATAEKGFKQILAVMEMYPANGHLMENCISAVWSLCLEDENEDLVIDISISYIIDAIKTHSENKKR